PSWFAIVVRSFEIGLSSRSSSTSTSAVISSPGATGARKLQSTWRKTLPWPRQVLPDDGVQQSAGDAALHDHSAEPAPRPPRPRALVVVERVPIAGQLGEELDVARRKSPGTRRLVADVHLSSRERRRSLSTRPPVWQFGQ